MKKIIILILAGICQLSLVFAQTDIDALRYSQPGLAGTARYVSMGGAFGALGGDFSSLAGNPAGIGIYRKSEFSFTPSIFVGGTKSTFFGNTDQENKFNFNLGNIGLVFTQKLTNNEDGPGWKSWNFGFGYNRIANFNNRFFIEGFNPSNSMTNYFAEHAQGTAPENLDPFSDLQAYNTYLINPVGGANDYEPAVLAGNITQRMNDETSGSIGEMNFTFGGNYGNKLYLGGTLAFSSLRFNDESVYEEIDKTNQIDSLNRFEFDQTLHTRGSGVNLKFGMIYRIDEHVRLGIAVHTPTWYSMHDSWVNSTSSRFDAGENYFDDKNGTYDYQLTTPFKALASLAYVIGNQGLLSVDYEFMDPSQSRFDASTSGFADVNNAIRQKYAAINTLHAGMEWRIGDYSLRGGYVYSTSPIGYDFTKQSFCAGLGVRQDNMSIDLGYVYAISNQYFVPYLPSSGEIPSSFEKVKNNNFTLTFGFKF